MPQPYTSEELRRIQVLDNRYRNAFNYRLLYAPPKVLDYVVVHELCHITHMNHSKDFWNMVASIMPDYKEAKQWLKEHGKELNAETHMKKRGLL